jgi:signal transduction histidine kinase
VVTTVAAVLLVGVGFTVDLVSGRQIDRDLRSEVSVHAQRADLLIQRGTSPVEIVRQLNDPAVIAEVRTADGTPIIRSPTGDPVHLGRHGGFETDPTVTRTLALPDRTRLILTADHDQVDFVRDTLRMLLVVVGGIGLVLAAVAMLLGVRAALHPLDTMTRLAERITAGDRGRRLRPDNPDTEIGRTATAFDAMLDALEAAQARAESNAAQARQAEATAQRSVSALRQFLSDAAHELRTPLTSMQNLAETLVLNPELELAHRERLATNLVRETSRAAQLVSDMLQLTRIEQGLALNLQPIDATKLTALAAREVDRTRLLAPELSVHLHADTVTPPGAVLADQTRIAQVLTNLLDNARRHTPEGGMIELTLSYTTATAHLTVRDSGPGVPEADRERIFERLVRLDDARARDAGGAGLGLAIARSLARAHHGDLRYLSSESGAAFRLSLPLTAGGARHDRHESA